MCPASRDWLASQSLGPPMTPIRRWPSSTRCALTLRAPVRLAADTEAMSRGSGVRGSTTTNGKSRSRSDSSSFSGSGGTISTAPAIPGSLGSPASTWMSRAESPALSTSRLPCRSSVSAIEETITPK